jgi:hypothetical protein
MSKYSLVKLMESDEDGIAGRVALSQDIVIYPKGETTITQIENALKDKANYKKVFTELSTDKLEGRFGPQLPNVKKSMQEKSKAQSNKLTQSVPSNHFLKVAGANKERSPKQRAVSVKV